MKILEYIVVAVFIFLFYLFLFPHLKVVLQEVNNPYSLDNNRENCLEVKLIHSRVKGQMIFKCVRFWTGDWERTVSYDEWDFPILSPVIQGGFVVSNFNN